MASEEIQDVIWIQTGFLGDIILNTGAFELVANNFPEVNQHLITTAIGRSALDGDPRLKSIWVFNKRQGGVKDFIKLRKNIVAKIPAKDRALILQPHLSYRSSFLASFIGIPRITYHETKASWGAKLKFSRVAVCHESVRIALLLEGLGLSRETIGHAMPKMHPLQLTSTRDWEKKLANHDGRVIAVAPGSVWKTKRWIESGFADVCNKLLETYSDAMIVFLGSRDDEGSVVDIVDNIKHKNRLCNLAGQTSLKDLRRLYPNFSLVLSNDSSPIHYASAFGIPTVAVFGSTIPELGFRPLSPKNIVVEIEEMACRPCGVHGPERCPLTHFKCMKNIQSNVVFEACVKLLQS